jgi:purine-binding chemotaxis protein CheW
MRKMPQDVDVLVEPQKALRVYLDALLCEATFTVAEETSPANFLEATNDSRCEPDVAAEPNTSTTLESPFLADVATNIEAEAVVDVCEAHATLSDNTAETVFCPDWGQARFQALSFQVTGVTLAAPLEKLHGIVELTEKITELPGYAPWIAGLLPHRGQNVLVVDIAKIIMSGRGAAISPLEERMKYLILVENGKFGLVADSISHVLNLESGDVRWRSEQSRRPWLAGMVTNKMCAVLEIDELCAQLEEGLHGVG